MKRLFAFALLAVPLFVGLTATALDKTGAHVTGVVTKIDQASRQLSLVVPAGEDVDVTQIGKSFFVERGVNLISMRGSIDSKAKVYLDGKEAKLSDLTEGDIVRTTFDTKTDTFNAVAAISQAQIDSDVGQARTNLKQEVNGALNK